MENIDFIIGQEVKIQNKEWFDKQELTEDRNVVLPDFMPKPSKYYKPYGVYKESLLEVSEDIFTLVEINDCLFTDANNHEKTIIVKRLTLKNKNDNASILSLDIFEFYVINFKPIAIPEKVTKLIEEANKKYKFYYLYDVCSGGGSGKINYISEKTFIPCLKDNKVVGISIPWLYRRMDLNLNEFRKYVIKEGYRSDEFQATSSTYCKRHIKFAATEEELDKPFKWN